MTTEQEAGVSRRNFIKAAAVTAVAAAATGGGAAFLKRAEKPVIITAEPALSPANITPPATAANSQTTINQPVAFNADDLYAQLAQAQAENLQLQANLDALQRELTAWQTAEQESRTARDTLTMELDASRQQLGVLGGLVALYEQLDATDAGAIIENGLAAVGGKINELLAGTPDLISGLDNGQTALAQIESHIPLLDSGRQWLAVQVDKVQGFYGEVESWLQRAVEKAGDFLQLLTEWFESLRRWLPFGAGDKAAGVMGALTTLLGETPATISGLDTNIAQPLDVWLSRIDGEPAIQRLLRPVRDEAIARARVAADQANQVGSLYEEQLVVPVRTVLSNRQSLQQAIADYRQQNKI
jgi:hypothetical protein